MEPTPEQDKDDAAVAAILEGGGQEVNAGAPADNVAAASRAVCLAWAAGDAAAAGRAAEALATVLARLPRPAPIFGSNISGGTSDETAAQQLDREAAAELLASNGAAAALSKMLAEAPQAVASPALRALMAVLNYDNMYTVFRTTVDAPLRVMLKGRYSAGDVGLAVDMLYVLTSNRADLAPDYWYDAFLSGLARAFLRAYRRLRAPGISAADAAAWAEVLKKAGGLIEYIARLAFAASEVVAWDEFVGLGLDAPIAELAVAPPPPPGAPDGADKEGGAHVETAIEDNPDYKFMLQNLAAEPLECKHDIDHVAPDIARTVAAAAAAAPAGRERAGAAAAELLRKWPFEMGKTATAVLLHAARTNAALRAQINELRALRTRAAIVGLARAARGSAAAAAPAGAE